MSDLFLPLALGDIHLPNRIVMAPLTRTRATPARIPTALMAEYYAQRASAGLIISEATSVCPMGVGYPNTPGIWLPEHIQAWQTVTQAVQAAGGRMVLQLWHVGRISHPCYLNGELPVAPSAIAPSGHVSLLRPETPYVTPRALSLEEIPSLVEAFRQGAIGAQLAGFDGVEIHAANGYLLDQFLQSSTNQRTDAYGGSLENRARLLLEVTDAVVGVWGASRVGVHLSPRGDAHSMGDANPEETFTYVAKALGQRHLAFLCVRSHFKTPSLTAAIKQAFAGPVIGNEQLTAESASVLIQEGVMDAAAFGQLFIANPDLVNRFKQRAPLNTPDASRFYGQGQQGYTDYPLWQV